MTKEEKAEQALKWFFARVQTWPVHNPMSYTEFKNMILTKSSPRFFSLFGASVLAAEQADIPTAKIKLLMEDLADSFKGDLPNKREITDFYSALLKELGSFRYRSSVFVSQIGSGLVEAGATIGNIAKTGVMLYALGFGLVAAFFIFGRKK